MRLKYFTGFYGILRGSYGYFTGLACSAVFGFVRLWGEKYDSGACWPRPGATLYDLTNLNSMFGT